jgi:hypothetical protein
VSDPSSLLSAQGFGRSDITQYDEARSHLLQCLDIQECHLSSKNDKLVETYQALIEIEDITGNHQQSEIYLQQASRLANPTTDK